MGIPFDEGVTLLFIAQDLGWHYRESCASLSPSLDGVLLHITHIGVYLVQAGGGGFILPVLVQGFTR